MVPCLQSGGVASGWLPFRIEVTEGQVFRARVAGIPDFSGLAASDFFYRQVLGVPLISSAPPGARLDPDGIAGVVPSGKGKVVFCQIAPDFFADAWQRTKALRVWATVLGNNGVRSTRPEPQAEGDGLSSLFYSAPSLTFNPDRHRSW
jgi:hypothetical protein